MRKLLIRCPIKSRSGYGAHSREIVRALYEMRLFDIYIDDCPWGLTPLNALDLTNDFDAWLHNRCITSFSGEPDVYIQITVPDEFQRIGKFNIGITAGIETDLIPKNWVDGCNKMDLIITTSQLSKTVIENSIYNELDPKTDEVLNTYRVVKPVKVLFEGVDVKVYNNQYDFFPLDIKEDFCFLLVGHWLQGAIGEDRKNVGLTIKLFAEAFQNYENKPALILKTSAATFSVMERERIIKNIKTITSQYPDCPPVYFLFGDLTDEEMNNLYNHPKVKAMVSFSKGEGFGRPLLEFSLTGKPIIASAWGGHLDFINENTTLLVQGEMTEVHPTAINQYIINGAKWFSINQEEAVHCLKKLYDNYDACYSTSLVEREHIKYKFNFNSMKDQLKIYLDTYLDVKPKEFKFNSYNWG